MNAFTADAPAICPDSTSRLSVESMRWRASLSTTTTRAPVPAAGALEQLAAKANVAIATIA